MSNINSEMALSRRNALRSGALLGLGGMAAGLPVASPLLAQDPFQWRNVSAMIDKYVDGRKVSGMATALGFGQEFPQYMASGTLSFGSEVPVDVDSLFRIYSMTKPITGMAVMMCIADGLLSLDQPVAEILPAFANMKVQKEYDGAITEDNLEPAVRPITIRHLLTHTAGLGYTVVQQGPISEAYARNGVSPAQLSRISIPGVPFSADPAESLELFADNLAKMPLVYQPGTKWSYSIGLDLLGRVIEVVTGKAFDEFLSERIFQPCGMESTFFQVPQSEKHRLTTNYFILRDENFPVDPAENSIYLEKPAFPFGGAGLVSTARDYDRFLQMLGGYGEIEGKRVMSEPSVRLGTSDLFPNTLAEDGGFTYDGRAFGYGAGGLVGRGDAEGLYGWFGAAGTAGLVNMKWGLRHNLMAQYMPASAFPIQTEFPTAVAADALAYFGG